MKNWYFVFSKIFSRFSFLSFLILGGIFVSCSNANQLNDTFDESDTLRYTAEKLYASTNWTEELETNRLSSNAATVDGISNKLSLTPLIVAASIPTEESSVFPLYGSFGSLDTTLISSSLRKTLISFCESFSSYKDESFFNCESFFRSENLYSLSLFYLDFKNIFDDCFGISVLENQKNETENSEKNDELEKSDKNEKNETSKKKEKEPVVFFDKIMLGQPFLDGIYYEVPAKLIGKKANLTLTIFTFEEAGIWKIDQVQISDWEILDAEK